MMQNEHSGLRAQRSSVDYVTKLRIFLSNNFLSESSSNTFPIFDNGRNITHSLLINFGLLTLIPFKQ